MIKNILDLTGVKELNKEELTTINGGILCNCVVYSEACACLVCC